MKYLLLVFLLPTMLFGQRIPSLRDDITERTCPYDDTQTGFYTNDYKIYQTLDDTYEGPVDSSFCPTIVLTEDGRQHRLLLGGFDFNRPLFIRYDVPENVRLPLYAYTDYVLTTSLTGADVESTSANECVGDCNQTHLSYRMIDPAISDTVIRKVGIDVPAVPQIENSTCFFSERYPEQQLLSIGTTLYLRAAGDNPRLRLRHGFHISSNPNLDQPEVEAIVFGPDQRDGRQYVGRPRQVVIPFDPNSLHWGFHLPQVEDQRPGNDAVRYTDVTIENNPDTAATIELQLFLDDHIVFPPYTALRPGLVAGQDSLRHQLIVSYPHMYFQTCSQITAERSVAPGTQYSFGEDDLRFGSSASCFLLQKGSGLRVRSGKHLVYGHDGQGMLAPRDQTTLSLEEGASMAINNLLKLLQRPYDPEGGLTVKLSPGSQLSFGPEARVMRKFAEAPGFITVHGQRSQVDFGSLSAEERSLFRFVNTPAPIQTSSQDETWVFPNPASPGEVLTLLLPRNTFNEAISYTLYDMAGKMVLEGSQPAMMTRPTIDLPFNVTTGVHFLELTVLGRTEQIKVVIR